MVFYCETLSEIGEMAADLMAEVRAELDQNAAANREASAKTAAGAAEHHTAE
jgi:hypothetical protein